MKKVDLYSFQRGLELAEFTHPRVTYAVQKNRRKVDSEIKDMEVAIKQSEKFVEFVKAREELAKQHSEKDDKGNPKTKEVSTGDGKFQRIYVIPGQDDITSKYRKELTKIEKKYEDVIKEHTEKVRKYNEEFLNDESEYKPFMIDLELLEQYEKCPQEVMNLIHWMIKEPKEE